MKITINQEELIELVKEYVNNRVDEVIIELDVDKYSKDSIYIKKNSWFVGSFIKKHIKGEDYI